MIKAVNKSNMGNTKKTMHTRTRYLFLVSLPEERQECFGDHEGAQSVGEENVLEFILVPVTSTCFEAAMYISNNRTDLKWKSACKRK